MPVNTSKSTVSFPVQRMYSCFLLTTSSSHWTKIPDSSEFMALQSLLLLCPHASPCTSPNEFWTPARPSFLLFSLLVLFLTDSDLTSNALWSSPPTYTAQLGGHGHLELELKTLNFSSPFGAMGTKPTLIYFIDLIKGNRMQGVPGPKETQETSPPPFLHLPKPWPSLGLPR